MFVVLNSFMASKGNLKRCSSARMTTVSDGGSCLEQKKKEI